MIDNWKAADAKKRRDERSQRAFNKRVGIIMISASTNESTCTEVLEDGADMYITKPVDFHYLTTNILPHLMKTKDLN